MYENKKVKERPLINGGGGAERKRVLATRQKKQKNYLTSLKLINKISFLTGEKKKSPYNLADRARCLRDPIVQYFPRR